VCAVLIKKKSAMIASRMTEKNFNLTNEKLKNRPTKNYRPSKLYRRLQLRAAFQLKEPNRHRAVHPFFFLTHFIPFITHRTMIKLYPIRRLKIKLKFLFTMPTSHKPKTLLN